MTSSFINTDYTFLYSDAQEILKDYDFNKDGKITYADYWYYRDANNNDKTNNNTIEFTAEEIQAWEVIFLVENEGERSSSSINEDNASSFLKNQLGSPDDPADAITLNELQTIGKKLTAYIRNCTELVETFDEMLKVHEENLKSLTAEKAEVEKKYEEKAATVKNKEEELKVAIRQAIDKNRQWNEDRVKRCNEVVEKCLEDYKNGELGGNSLSSELSYRLYCAGFSNGAFNSNNIDKVQECGKSISELCYDISSLTKDIRNVNSKMNKEISLSNVIKANRTSAIKLGQTATKLYESGYQRRLDMRKEIYNKYHKESTAKDKHSINNEQVQMLKQFLDNGELKNMPLTDAWAVVKETFNDCGIELKDDGSMVVPKGHGKQAKAVYQDFVTQMKELFNIDKVTRSGTDEDDDEFSDGGTNVGTGSGAGNTKRNDPIGFELDDVSYNFIIDRDNDGKFDDQTEFLGAKKGWAEMKNFDIDGNGIIEGDELKDMKLLAVDNETGQYTFMNAQEAGIDAIDLNSYKTSNSRQVNNNVLAGTFNITVNGEEITGKQTFDSVKNLNNNFSMIYGSDIADLSDDYKENPFVEEFVETVNTEQVKNSTNSSISNTKHKVEENTERTTQKINAEATAMANKTETEVSNDRKLQKIREEQEEQEKKKDEEEN